MAKYRFEVVLKYPDDMHPEDIIDMKKIMYQVKTMLEQYGFEGAGFYHGINKDSNYTQFLRYKEHPLIEATSEEEPDFIESLTYGQLDEEDI